QRDLAEPEGFAVARVQRRRQDRAHKEHGEHRRNRQQKEPAALAAAHRPLSRAWSHLSVTAARLFQPNGSCSRPQSPYASLVSSKKTLRAYAAPSSPLPAATRRSPWRDGQDGGRSRRRPEWHRAATQRGGRPESRTASRYGSR